MKKHSFSSEDSHKFDLSRGNQEETTKNSNTQIELMTILESTADAILVIDKNRRLIHYNNKFTDMWKIPSDILNSRDDMLLIEHAKSMLMNPDNFSMGIEEIMMSGKDKLDTFQFKDGRIIERFHKSYTIGGENEGSVWSFRDITERKKAEELQKSLEMKQVLLDKIKEYDEIKTNFFSTVSHEFKTPLNIILGAVQLLNEMHDNTQCTHYPLYNKYTHMMRQNCNRLLKLINNLVDITRIDAGFMELNLKNQNIVEVIEDITLSTVDYIRNKGLTLIFDTETEEKITACDAEKLERVILNLLSNAIKFTKPGGSIEVKLLDREDSILLSRKDTGIGIPPDMIDKVFDRFKQVDSSFTRKTEGSGIGLSIVKSMIELQGGNITLKSEVGKGSEFIIELPVRLIEQTHSDFSVDFTRQTNVERINIEFSDIYS